MYKYHKSLVLKLFGTVSLKEMLHEVEEGASNNLWLWLEKPSIESKEGTAKLIFELAVKKFVSYGPFLSSESLTSNFVAFIEELISFLVNFIGTTYQKCLQARAL